MNNTNTNNSTTVCATGDVINLSTPKMTKEESQQKTDAELLQMIQDAKGHTGNDFSDHMNCDSLLTPYQTNA